MDRKEIAEQSVQDEATRWLIIRDWLEDLKKAKQLIVGWRCSKVYLRSKGQDWSDGYNQGRRDCARELEHAIRS